MQLFNDVEELFLKVVGPDSDKIEELRKIFGIYGECKGIKADKSKCTLQAKENGYCGKHNPDKVKATKDEEEVKPKVKASSKKKVVEEVESEEEEVKSKVKASPKKKVVEEVESEEEVKPKVKSPPKKKVVEQVCNYTNPKTQVKCSHTGTVKPEGAAFFYCKRHSEKSAEIEKILEDKIEEEEEIVLDENEFE